MRMTLLTNWLARLLRRNVRSKPQRVTSWSGLDSLEDRQVLSGFRFDFGGTTSPVASGYERVPVVSFDNARGWGWATRSGVGSIDRYRGDTVAPDLTRDFHYGRDNTFRVNVANGVYDIMLQLGDYSSLRDRINIDIEGNRVETNVSTARGQFFQKTYRATINDGQLSVRLTDAGGLNSYWAINSLDVRPIATTEAVATVGLTSGWASFGQALSPNAAFEELRVGTLPTQTDVKTRWPDGSIRFAVVTAEVTNGGSYAVTPAFFGSGHVQNDAMPTEVRFTTGLADMPQAIAALPSAAAPDSLWLDGVLATEGRWSVIPTDVDGHELSGLRVLFDQRTYLDGSQRLAVTVENADDTASNQLRNLDVQIWADADRNGLLDELLFDRSDIAMGSGTRFIQRFDFGLNASTVTPDLEPLFRSGALPRYAAAVTNTIDSAFDENGSLRPEFDLLGPGDLNPYMGSPGGRPEIAPYTDWTARYLVHQSPEQAEYLLRMGDLAGSWPIHLREPTDGDRKSVV